MCDVFFFGTALKIPSQMSDIRPGIFMAIAGMVIDADKRFREAHDSIAMEDVVAVLCKNKREN